MSSKTKVATPVKKLSVAKKTMEVLEKPKAGANSWHYFQYEEKLKHGTDYDYEATLNKWRSMSDNQKAKYEDMAEKAPRHKALPGAGRGVSAYDVLRRDLSNLAEGEMKEELDSINLNVLAPKLRKHLEEHSYSWGPDGEKWLTTPTEDHYKAIKRAIKLNPGFI